MAVFKLTVPYGPKRQGFSTKRETTGFTLIELLVVMTIIAVLATIGFVAYSQSQKFARDSRRKQDLKALSTALELYYQKNGRYPSAGWSFACKGGPNTSWITDQTTPSISFDTTYINNFPQDPLTGSNCPQSDHPDSTQGSYDYVYVSSSAFNQCAQADGSWYLLYTQLENQSDQDSIGTRDVKACGSYLKADLNWLPYVFAVTSQ